MFKWIMVGTLLLCGCTYQAKVLDTPAYNIAKSYSQKVPGTWLLYVDATPLERPVQTSTYACSFHKFPIEVSGAFKSSVNETLTNLMEHVVLVNSPPTIDIVVAQGATGAIVVRGEEVRPRLDVRPGFWTANMDAQATVVASVTVDGKKGRLFGTTVEGQGNATSESGAACEGGAKALAGSVGQAMGDTMRRLGEAISNSERIRNGNN